MALELIQKVYKKKDEKREKLREDTLNKLSSVLKDLGDITNFNCAYIFGSVTKPYDFYERSDLDVAFEGLEKEKYFQVVAFISRKMGRDVDVIELEQCRFRAKIEKEGILWKRGS